MTPTEVTNENSEDKPIIQEEQEITPGQGDGKQQQEVAVQSGTALQNMNSQVPQQEQDEGKAERPLTIEDIVKPGKFGVTNSQMIPAIKRVIAEGSVEKLRMLRFMYLYSFEN